MERFLLAAAEDNIQIVNASNSAQLFHLMRRQMVRDVRKPLIVFTPKSLLRAKIARSPVSDLLEGTFEEVIDDAGVADASTVERIILASGKVTHEAIEKRDELGAAAAIVRVEQLYPWPFDAVGKAVGRYPNATEIVWLQEEPENMGAWNSAKGRLYESFSPGHRIHRISRPESGSPAAGSNPVHVQEQADLLERAFAPLN